MRPLAASLAGMITVALGATAVAHVEIASGPAQAKATAEVSFGVGHGCAGADTQSVRVSIPPEVTSVRALPNPFGKVSVETDAAGLVTAVTWQKADADLLAADTNYYRLSLRIKVPDAPFTTLPFPARQTCKSAAGVVTTVDWAAVGPNPDGGTEEPAPTLLILPARRAGWNKFTIPADLPNLTPHFDDAQIVWKGTAAYSASATTGEQISGTTGVTRLSSLSAGDVIWVKY